MKIRPCYIITKLKIISFHICKNTDDHGILNNVKVEDLFVKTECSNWKNARSADTGFQKHKSSKCHKTAIQGPVQVPKTTQDDSITLINNLTETQCENRASLLKIMLCVCYFAKQELPFTGHVDDEDTNFGQL